MLMNRMQPLQYCMQYLEFLLTSTHPCLCIAFTDVVISFFFLITSFLLTDCSLPLVSDSKCAQTQSHMHHTHSTCTYVAVQYLQSSPLPSLGCPGCAGQTGGRRLRVVPLLWVAPSI